MTQARFELDPYTVRVLDVIKGQFGLKNRETALRKFTELHGPEHAEMIIDEKILMELDETLADHVKKYPDRTMTDKELNKLLGL